MKDTPNIQSAHAVLVLNNKYILQLRDEKPNIAAPGQWCLFGGKIEDGEAPLATIIREIEEELSLTLLFSYLFSIDNFADFENTIIRTHFFSSSVDSLWHNHKLREGKNLGIYQFNDITNLKMPHVMRRAIHRYHLNHL